ncbi:MAG: hypothetical protein J1F18_03700 [Lachnospiraceae bacterium]|nr:hypothetical protein [Lachnospiraceae bacterium]
MNFYIGNSIDKIDIQGDNVKFSDELIDFIYKLSKQVSFDMSKLYEINPYEDVVVPANDLSQIIEICNYILDGSLLQNFEEPDEGNLMVGNLVKFAREAISKNVGLISIGD